MKPTHIVSSIDAAIEIKKSPEKIWENITNVNIEQVKFPVLFKLLDIPRPLRAEVVSEGTGGRRIAYFETGKRFIQKIVTWKPLQEYSFAFNPEKGFRVGYVFELSAGVFQISGGAYFLTANTNSTNLKLATTYSIHKRWYWLLNLPVRGILKIFQRYLLTSVKRNAE